MLRYYHRYMTEDLELRKGRHRLFIPFKDNNVRKELSAASISHRICTTVVNSHATLQNSKSIQGKVKAHDVRAVATSLQFSTSRPTSSHEGRSGGSTFTSFYLRNLYPQADSRRKTRLVVATREVIEISS